MRAITLIAGIMIAGTISGTVNAQNFPANSPQGRALMNDYLLLQRQKQEQEEQHGHRIGEPSHGNIKEFEATIPPLRPAPMPSFNSRQPCGSHNIHTFGDGC